jgi:hypothetical protein
VIALGAGNAAGREDGGDEWDAERDAGYPNLERLRAEKLSPEVVAFEEDLRARLGERAQPRTD